MRIYRGNRPLGLSGPCVCALGNFDGVHLGHQNILRLARDIAADAGVPGTVYTFASHPENVLAGVTVTPIITPNDKKARLVADMGIDHLVFASFDEATRGMSPAEFVRVVLKDMLGASTVVCGFHYHFAQGGAGDAQMLKGLCAGEGIEVRVVQPVTMGGLVISSSHIRSLVQTGDIGRAAELLGRPFSIEERVTSGKKLGRELGFPTINQPFVHGRLIPMFGVYVTQVHFRGRVMRGVTNVGVNPTAPGQFLSAETHILDFDGDLYGHRIEVEFLQRLRDEQRFPSLEALQEQVRADMESARGYNGKWALPCGKS